MERIKCEEAIRDNEKGEMVEIVQALLNIMSRRLDHTGENALDKENINSYNNRENNKNVKESSPETDQEEHYSLKEIRKFIENLKKVKKNKKIEDENDKLLRKLAQLKKKIDNKLENTKAIADIIVKKREVV